MLSPSSSCWSWTGFLLGCVVVAAHATPASSVDERVWRYARAPELSLAALSPTGSQISFVQHSADRQTVVLRDLRASVDRPTLSVVSRDERIRWCDWIAAKRLLCGTIREARRPERIVQRTRLYAIGADSGDVRELNRRLEDPIRDQVIGTVPGSNRVLLQHDPIGRGYPEVAELDIANGALHRVVQSHPPVRRWMAGKHGDVRLGIAYEAESAALYIRGEGQEDWSVLLEQSLADLHAVAPLAFAAPGELLVLRHHAGRAALFSIDIDEEEINPRLLFADAAYDITGPVMLDPRSGEVLSVQYVREQEVQHALDEREAARIQWLNERLPERSNLIVDRSADGQRLLVRSSSDVDPPSLYLCDVAAASLTLVGHEYPELEDRPLAPMKSIVYAARDGQPIPAYLTLPPTAENDHLPAIVLPHGGPETRNWRTFDPLVQFLAAEGYAVLQMNYRGSFGYGAGFAAAGARQWGGVIHNDITDGARWIVEQKIADPTRVCIVGQSFGGYAALLGAVRESQWYACAASFAGVSDLLALSQSTARLQEAEVWRQRLGEDLRALWQMSPLARAHAVETPVLLMHGRRDAVVPASQSKRFARALREADKAHRLVERSDCDHEMTVQSCRVAFFTELQDFLANALHR